MKKNKVSIIIIVVFFILNLVNCLLVTNDFFVENLQPYKLNFFLYINAFIGNLCILAIIFGIGCIIFKKRSKFFIYLLISTFVINIFLFVLSIFINYYGMMFTFDCLGNLGKGPEGEAMNFIIDVIPNLLTISVPYFIISPFILLALLIVYIIFSKKEKEDSTINFKHKNRFGLIVLLSGFFVLTFNNILFELTKEEWHKENDDALYSVQSKGVLNHYIYECIDLMFNSNKSISESDKQNVLSELDKISDEVEMNYYTNILKDKNLLLIQLESINNFVIGLEVEIDGEFYEVTPNLNKLVKENIYFNNFYTSVGIGNTSDAEFSVITGLYPTGPSYPIYKYDENYFETLPELFKACGYYTFSVHANSETYYDRINVHKNIYKFDNHFGSENLSVKDEDLVHYWLGDEDMLIQTIDMISNSDEKTFAFAITISNHTPFSKPCNAISDDKWFKNKDNLLPINYELSKNEKLSSIFSGYLEYASYTDYAIGTAMDYLEEKGLIDDTVVMLYGDHGIDNSIYEMFYDYPKKFKNNINDIITDGHENQKLLEIQMLNEIPMIIANPALESKTISLARSLPSLRTTICNLFGLDCQYYFSNDALSDKKVFSYSVKNGLIFDEDIIVSSNNGKYALINKDVYISENEVSCIIDDFKKVKDLNTKILKYNLLKKDN